MKNSESYQMKIRILFPCYIYPVIFHNCEKHIFQLPYCDALSNPLKKNENIFGAKQTHSVVVWEYQISIA